MFNKRFKRRLKQKPINGDQPDTIYLAVDNSQQYNVLSLLKGICENTEGAEGFRGSFKVTVLDREYREWLSGQDDAGEQQAQYQAEMPEDKRNQLLKKNGFDYTVWPFAIVFACCGNFEESMTFNVPKDTTEKIRDYFSKFFNLPVYVPPYLMAGDLFVDRVQRLQMMAHSFFQTGKTGNIEAFKTSRFDLDYTIHFVYLPVMVGEQISSATVDYSFLMEDDNAIQRYDFAVPFEKNIMTDDILPGVDVPEVQFERASAPLRPITTPTLVSLGYAPEFEDRAAEAIEKAYNEKN